MKITRSVENGVVVFHLAGPLDSTTSADLQAAALPAAQAAPHLLIIDFAEVDYVSSAGLRVILMAAKQARAAGGEVVVCGLNNPVRETFEISGFTRVVSIVTTRAEALLAIRAR